ncbi:MAG TPA: S-adenosylmethionine decarboxylase [Candidatus Omnitrophota bacterium]|nr:S-adenosylmethionine decarboxylase [Candidatus Omnitrophota bacterium]HQO59096.1 S-adenosylmethionine decarboxylase [Candidatus Omnitrophota bacterium]
MEQKQAQKKQKAFGYELLLDFYHCKPGVCDNLDLCYQFLDTIVGELGMEKQAPPSIFRSDIKRFPEKAGLSGWVPLIESSVVIHTLSLKNFITIDIYSCRDFDEVKALELSKKYFLPAHVESQFLYRGLAYYDA